MAVRLHFIVEGQTEVRFVRQVLAPHLADLSIVVDARRVQTSHKGGVKHSGGISNYELPKRDILQWMSNDRGADARFTTMFDLYGLPSEFPGYSNAALIANPYEKVRAIEDALGADINDRRFIPYIQLHEFEALILSNPEHISGQFGNRDVGIRRLAAMSAQFESPEHIDDGVDTAPSKRIIREIPEYEGRKASAGPIVAAHIGLPTLWRKCAHFGEWIDRLERLAEV